MRARINLWIDALKTGFWFLPSLMLVFAIALAFILLYVDGRFDPGIRSPIVWAYSGGPEGARSLLSTIAGSMITAATVTFSLASVALSIASQQYGSRVLRNFMRDRITQILLGTFTATFIYSVLIVRAIRGSDMSGGFVPAISVTVAIALSLVSLILLIFFVHHISTSIKASHILRVISEDLSEMIPELFPCHAGDALQGTLNRDSLRGERHVSVTTPDSGYLQSIDLDALFDFAGRSSAIIEATLMPGDYHVGEGEIARVWGVDRLAEKDQKLIRRSFLLGGERTPAEDIRYHFQQLTEVIIRALSPGINDPFTAITGIDHLADGLAALGRQRRPASERADRDGVLRLILPVPTMVQILESTVGHIAIYAASDPFVMTELQRALERVAPELHGEDELSCLSRLRQTLKAARTAVQAG